MGQKETPTEEARRLRVITRHYGAETPRYSCPSWGRALLPANRGQSLKLGKKKFERQARVITRHYGAASKKSSKSNSYSRPSWGRQSNEKHEKQKQQQLLPAIRGQDVIPAHHGAEKYRETTSKTSYCRPSGGRMLFLPIMGQYLNISASDQTQFAKSSEALAGQYEAEIRRTRQKIRQSRGSQGSQQP